MNKFFAFIKVLLCLVIFTSCKGSEEQELVTPEILYFQVVTSSGQISCTINNSKGVVSIPQVKKGDEILSVKYQLTQGSTIYPEPSSKIGNWKKEEEFVVSFPKGESKKYKTILIDYSENGSGPTVYDPQATIYTGNLYGRLTKYFFFDIKDGGNVTADKAKKFYQTEEMNGIRVPIYGNYKDGKLLGHPAAGEVIADDYAKVISSIQNARQYNPNLLVFASKKLNGSESFPKWVMDSNGVNVDKYVGMLIDYLKFMKSRGIEVDVLGIDNEYNFNEGNITANRYYNIVNLLKTKITEEQLKMPRFIGPERYNPQGFTSGNWLYNLFDLDKQGATIDIYGTHYYPRHHYFSMNKALKTEFNAINNKNMEFWATEPHWDNEELAKEDPLGCARMAICALWDQTDLGMDGFMWWAYPYDENDLRSVLMHDISNAIYNSQPIKMIDHDGEELLGTKDYSGKWTDSRQKPNNDPIFDQRLHTRAFIKKGNIVNVYLLNVRYKVDVNLGQGSSLKDYLIKVSDSQIDGDVEMMQWTDNTSVQGSKGKAKKISDEMISVDLPLRSITRLTFKIKK